MRQDFFTLDSPKGLAFISFSFFVFASFKPGFTECSCWGYRGHLVN